ncbi:MAG: hypothetical protein NC429_16550 [Lachnospiraceae bacterium]|nr:hypothetical protein [Lachnospiraceae bacterium]
MSILSGYKKFKKYLRTADGYRLCSEWTKSDSVEMNDGSTLQESMDTFAGDVKSTQNDVTNVQNELKTSLGGMTFGVDAAGRYGYIKAGADTVIPFKKNDFDTINSENIKTGSMAFSITVGATAGVPNPSNPRTTSTTSPVKNYFGAGSRILGVRDVKLTSGDGYGGIENISVSSYTSDEATVSITAMHHSTQPATYRGTYTIVAYVPS